MTPYEWLAGRPYEGQLAEFGESLMVLASRAGAKANRKGDPIWLRGVFLGKTDSNLFITWHMDGIKTSRSAKRCTEHFDSKGISSVGIHTWEVKHTTLTIRAIPRKNLPEPVAEVPPGNPNYLRIFCFSWGICFVFCAFCFLLLSSAFVLLCFFAFPLLLLLCFSASLQLLS